MFSEGWSVEDLEIYLPVWSRYALVAPNHHTYIMDLAEQRILRISPDGVLLPSIGRRGKGPGELEQGLLDCYLDDRLYVRDRFRNHSFTPDGTYLGTREGKHPNEKLYRMVGGWLIRALPENPRREKTETVYWLSDSGEEIVVHQWSSIWADTFGENGKILYNPVRERSMVAISEDRRLAYIRPSGKAELHVFSAITEQKIRTVSLDQPKILFDEAHGRRLYGIYMESARKWGREIVPEFPDYYPPVTRMEWASENKLLLMQVASVNGATRIANHWYLDRAGDRTSSEFLPEWHKFMVAIHDDWAYLTTFDTEAEVAGFRKMPLAEVSAFLTAHQAEYRAWFLENIR